MWQAGVFVFCGWIASVCFHEFGHAIAAYFGGDTSVKEKGYLTFNPLKYAHPQTSLVFPVLFMLMGGIGLPGGAVYINNHALRNRFWQSLVSAAGPLANLILALILAITLQQNWVAIPDNGWLWPSLAFLILLQVSAVIFNLLPIPPLDGYGIIEPWLPPDLQRQFQKFSNWGFWIVFGLFWFVPAFSRAFWRLIFDITDKLGVSPYLIVQGNQLFHQPITRAVVLAGLLGGLWLLKQQGTSGSSSTSRPVSSRKEMGLGGLRKQMLSLVDAKTGDRLIALERLKNTDRSERWYLEKVIYDLRRHR
jgi:Zn-dependent protease